MATIKKNYNMDEDVLLERAQLFHDTLTLELADFTAQFPWLDAPWVANFQTETDAADDFPKDIDVTLDIEIKTGDVVMAMSQGRSALDRLGTYAKLAWPADLKRQTSFGQEGWTKAKRNTLDLKEALQTAHRKAENAALKTELLDKGMTQPDIDLLDSTADEIETKNSTQELGKSGRKVQTGDRTRLHNAVYATMKTINNCAQLVWADDEVRKAQYNLMPPGGGTVTTVVVTVTSGTPPEAHVGASVTIQGTTLDPQTTDSLGRVSFASTALSDLITIIVDDPITPPGHWEFPDQSIELGQTNNVGVHLTL